MRLLIIAKTDKIGSEVQKIITMDQEDYDAMSQKEINQMVDEEVLNSFLYDYSYETIENNRLRISLATNKIGSEMVRVFPLDFDVEDLSSREIEEMAWDKFQEIKSIEITVLED